MINRAALAVLVLSGMIAFTANGAPVTLRRGVDRLDALANVLVIGGVAAVLALAIIYAVHRVRFATGSDARSFGETLDHAAPAGSLALAALILLTISRTGPGGEISLGALGSVSLDFSGIASRWSLNVPGSGAFSRMFRRMFSAAEPGATTEVPPLLLLIAGAVVVAIVAWIARRSAERPSPPTRRPRISPAARPVPQTRVMREVFRETIDGLLADPDPRKAIIGAYARLLEGLSASGAPRHEYEAPLEHLRRVLNLLSVRPEPVRRLINLFELARFSTHELTERHRDQALEALRLAAEDLEASGSRRPTAAHRAPRSAAGARRVAR